MQRRITKGQIVDGSTGSGQAIDVFCAGTVFFDVVFTGLPDFPLLGTEMYAPGMGSSPGGIANLAVALSRLGLNTALCALFGTDAYGDYCWETLAGQEGVDLTTSRRLDDWHSPVTASLVIGGDRTMVTHGHDGPMSLDEVVGNPPLARAYFANIAAEEQTWVRQAHELGGTVFADIGWEQCATRSAQMVSRLRYCDVFLPNSAEATTLTSTDSPEAALIKLTKHVPCVVITCGTNGVIAADEHTGETVSIPALTVDAIDSTGAGDVFDSGFVAGTLAGLPLAQRVRFASLCASLSVQHFGGSLSSPGWREIADCWRDLSIGCPEIREDYSFIQDLLPHECSSPVSRASATLLHR